MVSGKYSALSGAVAREQAMNNIASNLANVSTTGFKKDRTSFAAILRGAKQTADGGINCSKVRTIGTDFSQGGMEATDRPLDVAIDGEGFLKVKNPNNEIFYTRAGRLMIDQNGMIKTERGLNVLDAGNQPLQLDTSLGTDIGIADNGDISINGTRVDGKIQVFSVSDQAKLTKAGSSLYKLSQGVADQPLESYRVIQGSLESSNVNMMDEMTAMIATQRSFEMHNKVLESYAALADKLDELGSIG